MEKPPHHNNLYH